MNKNELDEIYSLLEQVFSASTKAESKLPLKRLEFIKQNISTTYGGNAAHKLSQTMSSAESAAGRVPDKEYHIQRAKMHWGTFKDILSRLGEIA